MEYIYFFLKSNICFLLIFSISHGEINIPKRQTDFDFKYILYW